MAPDSKYATSKNAKQIFQIKPPSLNFLFSTLWLSPIFDYNVCMSLIFLQEFSLLNILTALEKVSSKSTLYPSLQPIHKTLKFENESKLFSFHWRFQYFLLQHSCWNNPRQICSLDTPGRDGNENTRHFTRNSKDSRLYSVQNRFW